MPVFRLNKRLLFPPVHLAEPDGLLAVGGDLSVERLLLAYRSGIFPWFDERPILWWSPDPRFVLFPADLKVSASMKQVLRRNQFRITYNADFPAVIARCSNITRAGQDSTWITDEMQAAYIRLHQAGYAMSVESWLNDQLVGGLYGIKIGSCFFGESMFSDVSNASKAAFITFVQAYAAELTLIDCQVETEHLASLGAGFISRDTFLELIQMP
ncbi:leucyl/phenylalanyl-tRNA--protein transferase [Chitinophaga qingshengii]|uniref:Leucyl/phenylalanyl-tRNA--protein transferase n=1 Tax=Chitinophaga qingshengii TaxID=1569794 RepID=A0ABR7TLB7_9BACT|nr:leucyl/phenylalanyl-tRNA--protein transferase [Chitinophaga qingshengii]MBC9930445.1 leucyl/phenylalanyl-tRNA--protein transferase [Chitinophaga qingshengii]